jgi:hypothetical protein
VIKRHKRHIYIYYLIVGLSGLGVYILLQFEDRPLVVLESLLSLVDLLRHLKDS